MRLMQTDSIKIMYCVGVIAVSRLTRVAEFVNFLATARVNFSDIYKYVTKWWLY